MNCYSEAMFMKYVSGQATEEEQRKIEDHLYACDTCLDVYMLTLSQCENEQQMMMDSPNFTDEVIEKIQDKNKTEDRKPQGNPIIHYAIAAGLTLMLMFTGVFDGLTTIVSNDAMNPTKSGSFSDEVLNRTVQMIDLLNNNVKEDK